MTYLDPTITRISDTLLLSDLMICSSVAKSGFRNRFEANWEQKLVEGRRLGQLLDAIQQDYGPYSVCYGFISPELSKQIVTYQNPNKPSYHRWDIGAAADICVHEWVADDPPIELAHEIDAEYEYSRMITYSESEWICLATNDAESLARNPRKAFYENRYVGERKPYYVRYAKGREVRREQIQRHRLEHPWRGRGFPSYHGGGKRQYEHMRVGPYSTVLDFLYDRDMVHEGRRNPTPLTRDKVSAWNQCANMAGKVIQHIGEHHRTRVSVTRGYNRLIPAQRWDERFVMEVVPPTFLEAQDLAHTVYGLPEVAKVALSEHDEPRVRITGEYR